MYGTFISKQKIESIRIDGNLVFRDVKKTEKTHWYQRLQDHLFCIIIIKTTGKKNNCSINKQVKFSFFELDIFVDFSEYV